MQYQQKLITTGSTLEVCFAFPTYYYNPHVTAAQTYHSMTRAEYDGLVL